MSRFKQLAEQPHLEKQSLILTIELMAAKRGRNLCGLLKSVNLQLNTVL